MVHPALPQCGRFRFWQVACEQEGTAKNGNAHRRLDQGTRTSRQTHSHHLHSLLCERIPGEVTVVPEVERTASQNHPL